MPLHMRLPKLRGFKNPARVEYQVVNVAALEALYPEGGAVTVDDLVAKGAVRKDLPVKVLGQGDLGVQLQVTVHAFSATAKDKITAAGGTATRALTVLSGARRGAPRWDALSRARSGCYLSRSAYRFGPAAPPGLAPPGPGPAQEDLRAHRVRPGVPYA